MASTCLSFQQEYLRACQECSIPIKHSSEISNYQGTAVPDHAILNESSICFVIRCEIHVTISSPSFHVPSQSKVPNHCIPFINPPPPAISIVPQHSHQLIQPHHAPQQPILPLPPSPQNLQLGNAQKLFFPPLAVAPRCLPHNRLDGVVLPLRLGPLHRPRHGLVRILQHPPPRALDVEKP